MPETIQTIVVTFEAREDGGLRAYSADVPGLVLSHKDVDGVLADVELALSVIMSERYQLEVSAHPVGNIREMLERSGVVVSSTHPGFFAPGRTAQVCYAQ